VTGASWWEWLAGSTPFWRGAMPARQGVRDGLQVRRIGQPPRYTRPQFFEKNDQIQGQIRCKLASILQMGYIEKGIAHCCISCKNMLYVM